MLLVLPSQKHIFKSLADPVFRKEGVSTSYLIIEKGRAGGHGQAQHGKIILESSRKKAFHPPHCEYALIFYLKQYNLGHNISLFIYSKLETKLSYFQFSYIILYRLAVEILCKITTKRFVEILKKCTTFIVYNANNCLFSLNKSYSISELLSRPCYLAI